MRNWIRKHRLALGYVLVATVSCALLMAGMELMPRFESALAARGYEMESPQWLMLLGLVPLLWFVRLHSLTDMPFLQQLLSVTLRSAMIIALALSLTGITHITHEAKKTATVVVVDVSESVPDEVLEQARAKLQAVWDEKGDSVVRLVTFAETPRVVHLQGNKDGQLPAIQRHVTGSLGTDAQQAMRLAYGMFPPGHLKRLILVSDGNETAGNALAEAETAVRLGIRVHHLSYPEIAPQPELMVVGLDVPDEIEPNVPFDVSVTLMANHEGRAKCTLKVDKLVAGTAKVDFEKGEKTADFDEVRVREGGEHAFKVDCGPDLADDAAEEEIRKKDRFASNNAFELTRFVEEKKRLLYVEGEAMYSKNFRDALKDDFQMEVRGATGVPKSLTEMKRYKSIVVSDVPRHNAYYRENITTRQMHLMHDYVKQGGLLVFTGGQDSLGPGGYAETYLERRVLPVKLDVEHELETPRLALVLVIDRSGSMSGRKLELAKKAGRATVAELDKRDRVGIVAFDSGAVRLINMTRASAKTRFDNKLRHLTAGGGTAIYPALEEAFDMLEGAEAKVKHVILMTDGQSNRTGVGTLVQRATGKGITVSTIAVGAGSDRSLLQLIARWGNGRHYYTESAEAVPRLFVDETREVAGESLVEEAFRPVVARKYSTLRFLRGINVRRAPRLFGYVPTQAKRQAQVIFATPKGDPLLVRWKLGKGWVYVWTSDIKNKWSRRWIGWSGFAPFWRQLIKDGIHEEKRETEFPIQVDVARHELIVSTDAIDDQDRFVSGVTSKATVTDPNGKKTEVVLTQSAAGRYEARLPAHAYGPYSVDVNHEKDGKKLAVSKGSATYPYAEEHLAFEPDLTRIAALSEVTGGIADPDVAAVLSVNGQELTHRSPAWHWFLYVVLAAFLLDVFLRRIRLWPAKTQTWGQVRKA